MSLDDVTGEKTVADRAMDAPEVWTISDFIERYGEEATRRGLEYMASLMEAEEQYRQSADAEDLDKGWERAYGVEDVDTEASDKWVDSMEDGGLGLDK